MKSKLVKYPFKDGKRYRWDTYKMGKRFEYTWEQSPDANYTTITPYISAEPFDNSTITNEDYYYFDLSKTVEDNDWIDRYNTQEKWVPSSSGNDNPTHPSQYTAYTGTWYSSPTIRDYYRYANLDELVPSAACPALQLDYYENPYLEINNFNVTKIYYSILTLSKDNASNWGLTDADIDWYLTNNFELNTLIQYLKTYNASAFDALLNFNLPSYVNQYNSAYGDEYPYYKYNDTDIDFNYQIQNGKIKIGAYAGYNKASADMTAHFYKIKWVNEPNVGDVPTISQTDDVILSKTYPDTTRLQDLFSFGLGIIPNVYRFDVGGYVVGPGSNNANVYYISGKTYGTGPTKGSLNPYGTGYIIPKLTEITNIIHIGYKHWDDVTTWHNGVEIPIYNMPTNLSGFTWINAETEQNAQSWVWGIANENDGTMNACMLTTSYGVEGAGSGRRYLRDGKYGFIPLIRQSTNTPHYTWSTIYSPVTSTSTAQETYLFNLDTIKRSIDAAPIRQFAYAMRLSDWNNAQSYIQLSPVELAQTQYILKPQIYLIGDKTAEYINIEANRVYRYIPGEMRNNTFYPKTLQYQAPCEYQNNNNTLEVSSRSWLTFNSYTPEQWINEYHITGDNWNGIGSSYAYLSGISNYSDPKTIYFDYTYCPSGSYVNVFSLFGNDTFTVTDTENHILPANPSVFYNNLGSIINGEIVDVKSYNRNAYPDNGTRGRYYYVLKPEKTKFITYTNSTDETLNVELDKNRYYLPHTNAYFNRDTSLYGRVVGTTTSTNEDSIPDASWRKYMGLYLGDSIPSLGIVETAIPESQILGVPAYDKQINTSETLKYGTVAAASLTFTLNLPVKDAMLYNNEWLILYYDFTHTNDWERMGFFYIDSIESIDENTSRVVGHDETYKLNKYVDDFLENYSGEVTLGRFYHDLLDYCDCYYDTKEAGWRHYRLNNVYHAIKTTGIEVAHFVASIAPGFIHTNIDGDIVLDQYENTTYTIGIDDYADLQYTAYNSDLLNKVRITSNNVVIGEDTHNYGDNIYFISDNPLISTMDTETTLNGLADTILAAYRSIPSYRPAEIQFLVLPKPTIGQIFNINTLGGDTYKVVVMSLSVDASGVKIKSLGTQSYPVEAQSNSQFINIINDIDSVSTDVSNLKDAQQVLGQAINRNAEDIVALDGRLDTAENNISTLTTGLQNKINNDSISQSNNLTTIKINGTTVSNITNKTYVDNKVSASEARNNVAEANNLVTVKINNNEVSNIAKKEYVDALIGGNLGFAAGTLTYTKAGDTQRTCAVIYLGKSDRSQGLFIPINNDTLAPHNYVMFKVNGGKLYGLTSASSPSWVYNFWDEQATYSFTVN